MESAKISEDMKARLQFLYEILRDTYKTTSAERKLLHESLSFEEFNMVHDYMTSDAETIAGYASQMLGHGINDQQAAIQILRKIDFFETSKYTALINMQRHKNIISYCLHVDHLRAMLLYLLKSHQ